MRRFTAFLLCVCWGQADAGSAPPSFALAKALATPPLTTVPALDRAALAAEDAVADRKPQPWRYAVALPVGGLKASGAAAEGGSWTTLADGRQLWRFAVQASGASTVDLQFQPYRLPHGAELWVYTPDRRSIAGPYSDAHNNPERLLATPALPGERALVELVLPAGQDRRGLELTLAKVLSGYRGFDPATGQLQPQPKSGTCNRDVICPEGNDFRNQIQAVVRYTVNGGLCTGTLMNNTAQDGAPLFLTARHCFSTQSAAAGLVLYYNYNSPVCRAVGSSANGVPYDPSIASHTQTGTTLLASSTAADFTLVRLNQSPPAGANPYFAGWDRRNQAPTSGVGIHHPSGDEKRISFENNPLRVITQRVDLDTTLSLQAGQGLEVLDWDLGTTEQGSSGSALFSPEKRVVGTLTGGFALCGNDEPDYYGRIFTSFTGGGTASTRLADHLDPTNSGATTLDGRSLASGCSGFSASIGVNPAGASVLAGSDVTLSANLSGGQSPYTLTWDVDGDGINDRVQSPALNGATLLTRYNRATTPTIRLQAADSAGCMVTVQRAIEVDMHEMVLGNPTVQQVCGDNDNNVEPGERWRYNTRLTNFGTADVRNGQAVYTRTSTDARFRVLQPAVALPAVVDVNQAVTVSTEFYIGADASCSTQHSIGYRGVVDERGQSGDMGNQSNVDIPRPANCAPVAGCPVPPANNGTFRQGAFFNPRRAGNGLVSFAIPVANANPQFLGLWFTGEANRAPTWYFLQSEFVDGQASGKLVRRSRNVAASGFVTFDTEVGTGQVSLIDGERFVFTQQLTGQEPTGDLMGHLLAGLAPATPNRTGAWFYPPEAGWGQTYDSYLQSGVPTEFILSYVYDNTGFPRWVLSQDAASNVQFGVLGFRTHCPACAWLDIGPTAETLGTIQRQFNSATTGSLNTSFLLQSGGSWVRNGIGIEILSAPQPPQ